MGLLPHTFQSVASLCIAALTHIDLDFACPVDVSQNTPAIFIALTKIDAAWRRTDISGLFEQIKGLGKILRHDQTRLVNQADIGAAVCIPQIAALFVKQQ